MKKIRKKKEEVHLHIKLNVAQEIKYLKAPKRNELDCNFHRGDRNEEWNGIAAQKKRKARA